MSTTHARTLERMMTVVAYLIKEDAPLRLKDFSEVADDRSLYPLGKTTVKSALITAIKDKFVRAEALRVGGRRIIFYTPTRAGRKAHAAYNSNPETFERPGEYDPPGPNPVDNPA